MIWPPFLHFNTLTTAKTILPILWNCVFGRVNEIYEIFFKELLNLDDFFQISMKKHKI